VIDREVIVRIDQSRKVIDFGSGNTFGNVSIENVAGRDIFKVNATTAAAAAVDDSAALLRLIEQVRNDVSRLTDLPEAEREDADDDLRKAWEAGGRGNRSRLLEKLESAQKLLLRLAGKSLTALRVADTIGTLLQRGMGLRG
jgi:hypothetical protein